MCVTRPTIDRDCYPRGCLSAPFLVVCYSVLFVSPVEEEILDVVHVFWSIYFESKGLLAISLCGFGLGFLAACRRGVQP